MTNTTAIDAGTAAATLQAGAWTLRPWRESDAEALYRAVAASRDELGRWLAWAHADYAPADAVDWVARCERGWRDRSQHAFGVFAGDGEVLGGAGISRVDGLNRVGNLGYWVATAATGQGVARTAARAVARYGFEVLGLCRLEIVVLPDNRPSRRVALALGAQWECTARHRVQHQGAPAAAEVYALLASDLAAAPSGLAPA